MACALGTSQSDLLRDEVATARAARRLLTRIDRIVEENPGIDRDTVRHTQRAPLGRCKIPVLKLERILKSKKAAGRDKDRRVLLVLKDAIIAASGAQSTGKRRNHGKD
jgi:hypothetical protein